MWPVAGHVQKYGKCCKKNVACGTCNDTRMTTKENISENPQ